MQRRRFDEAGLDPVRVKNLMTRIPLQRLGLASRDVAGGIEEGKKDDEIRTFVAVVLHSADIANPDTASQSALSAQNTEIIAGESHWQSGMGMTFYEHGKVMLRGYSSRVEVAKKAKTLDAQRVPQYLELGVPQYSWINTDGSFCPRLPSWTW